MLTIDFRNVPLRVRYLAHKFFPAEGAYIGCDFTGEIVNLGPDLEVDLKVGDKVSATIIGSKCSRHTFAHPPGTKTSFSRHRERTRRIH